MWNRHLVSISYKFILIDNNWINGTKTYGRRHKIQSKWITLIGGKQIMGKKSCNSTSFK